MKRSVCQPLSASPMCMVFGPPNGPSILDRNRGLRGTIKNKNEDSDFYLIILKILSLSIFNSRVKELLKFSVSVHTYDQSIFIRSPIVLYSYHKHWFQWMLSPLHQIDSLPHTNRFQHFGAVQMEWSMSYPSSSCTHL